VPRNFSAAFRGGLNVFEWKVIGSSSHVPTLALVVNSDWPGSPTAILDCIPEVSVVKALEMFVRREAERSVPLAST
jgi:hypothetical protein